MDKETSNIELMPRMARFQRSGHGARERRSCRSVREPVWASTACATGC